MSERNIPETGKKGRFDLPVGHNCRDTVKIDDFDHAIGFQDIKAVFIFKINKQITAEQRKFHIFFPVFPLVPAGDQRKKCGDLLFL